jgi:hypothetical protein
VRRGKAGTCSASWRPSAPGRRGARLVALNERHVAIARQASQVVGLDGVETLQADAGITDACAGAVLAPDRRGVRHTRLHHRHRHPGHSGAALPSLCASGALVLWTKHRRPPDLTPAIKSSFREENFREEAFDINPDRS